MSKAFLILTISMFSSQLGVGIIAPLLPLYAERMGASGFWIGLVFASFAISQTLLTPIFGILSDRTSRKALLSIGLLSYALISFGYLWAHQIHTLTVVRLLHGAAGGIVLPVAQAYVGDLSPKGEEGKWIGYLNAALFAGFGFGPILGGTLTEAFGINATFYAMGGLNFIAFLLGVLFLPETVGKVKLAANPFVSLKQLSAKPSLQGLFSFQLAFATGRSMFISFVAIFAASEGLGSGEIGILLGANIIFMSLYQVFTGRMADKLNRKWLATIGGIVNCLLLALVPLSGNFWYLLLLFIVGAIGGALSIPSVSALAIGEGRKYGMGTVLGAINMWQGLGFATGPIFGGIMADLLGVRTVFYLAAGIGLLGLVLFIRLIRA